MASLDVIRTLTIRAKAEGVDAARSAVTGLGEAYESSAQRQLSMDRALANLERRFVTGARQTQEFERAQRQANLIVAQFPDAQDRVNRVLDEARAKLAPLSGGLDRVAAGMSQAGSVSQRMVAGMSAFGREIGAANDNTIKYSNTNRLARFELINLSRQIQDVGVSLVSGQAPMSVFIQQGSQIADVFASSALGLKGWFSLVVGFLGPTTALVLGLAAAFGTLAAAVLLFTERTSAKNLREGNEALDAQAKTIQTLQSQYTNLSFAIQQFSQVSEAMLRLQLTEQLVAMQKAVAGLVADFQKATTTPRPTSLPSEIPLPFGTQAIENAQIVGSAFTQLQAIIEKFNASARDVGNITEMRDALAAVREEALRTGQEGLAEAARKLLEATAEAGRFADGIARAKAIVEAFNSALKSTPWGDFIRGAEERIALLNLEAQSVGKSAAEVAKLRLQFDAETAARKQGQKALTDQQQAELNAAKTRLGAAVQNKEAAEREKRATDDLIGAQSRLLDLRRELARETEMVFLSDEDARIAERLKDLYPDIADAINSAEAAQIRFNNQVKQAQDLTGDFLNDFVRGMLSGKDATESLANALKNLGQSITASSLKNVGAEIANSITKAISGPLQSSLSSVLGSSLGGAASGLGGGLLGAAVGVGVSLLGSLFGGDNKAEQEAQARAAEAAKKALSEASAAMETFTSKVIGLNGAVEQTPLERLQDAQHNFQLAVEAAERVAEIAREVGGVTVDAAEANAAFAQAMTQIEEAGRALFKFYGSEQKRLIEFLSGPTLTESEKRMKELTDAAEALNFVLLQTGWNAEDAAAFVQSQLNIAIERLNAELNGTAANAEEAAAALEKFQESTQRFQERFLDAVDAQLRMPVGDTLDVRLAEFDKAARREIEVARKAGEDIVTLEKALAVERVNVMLQFQAEVAARAQALEDRLFATQIDAQTLEGRLAQFDRQASRERLEEAQRGGDNIVLLEQVLAAERQQIIDDFNEQALDAERQAAEDRIKLINDAAKSIVDYVNGLFAGSQATGSPRSRLDAARATYEATLAAARAGNLDAVNRLAADAENMRVALRDVYGSTQQYQEGLKQIATDLLNLPTVQSSTDQIVNAIRDSIIVLQQINAAVGGGGGPLNNIYGATPEGLIPLFQHGGWVGPSGGIAHPGEFVVNANAARANASMLQQLNMGSAGNDNVTAELRSLRRENAVMLVQIARFIAMGNEQNVVAIKQQQRATSSEARIQAERTQSQRRKRANNV